MKKVHLVLTVIAVAGLGLTFVWLNGSSSAPVVSPATKRSITQAKTNVNINVQEIASGLEVPWSIVFTGPKRMLVSERVGRIRVVQNNVLKDKPLFTFDEVSSTAEEGLMGLAIDPEYVSNKYMYACLAYEKSGVLFDKIVKLKDKGASANIVTTIFDRIPAAKFHAGCRIRFGPDNKLYITTGDATDRSIAQELGSLGGKVLRINADGSIPIDNPDPTSAIWSLGHRNPQGIDWHPTTNALLLSEHGPSGFDGPGGGDEINQIIKGENYGWPTVSHEQTDPRFATPLAVFTPAIAPASGSFYSSSVMPQFTNHFLVGALRGEGIYDLELSNNTPHQIVAQRKIPESSQLGRVREVVTGPDGYIYFTTSNRDGRGDPADNDDRILRLLPKE